MSLPKLPRVHLCTGTDQRKARARFGHEEEKKKDETRKITHPRRKPAERITPPTEGAGKRTQEQGEGLTVGTKDSRSAPTSRSIGQWVGSVSHRAQEQIDRRTYGPSYWKPVPSLVEELAQTNKTNARDRAI